MRVQFRWPVGMPLCRRLGEGLWEVRSNLSGHRIARLLRHAGPSGGTLRVPQEDPEDAGNRVEDRAQAQTRVRLGAHYGKQKAPRYEALHDA